MHAYRSTFIFALHNCNTLLPEVRYEILRLESGPDGLRAHKWRRSIIRTFVISARSVTKCAEIKKNGEN